MLLKFSPGVNFGRSVGNFSPGVNFARSAIYDFPRGEFSRSAIFLKKSRAKGQLREILEGFYILI